MNNFSKKTNYYIILWLSICALMVLSMIVLGGYTRLSGSGLSIVEWRPIVGIIPPLTADAWIVEFSKYKASPEFLYVNYDMDLEGFKRIYLVEYLHRALGRLVGLVFFIPFLFFIITKKINRNSIKRLGFILFLGALQGLIGWYMVKSGLIDQPNVSHYRLTLHLSMAILIIGCICWYVFNFFEFNSSVPSISLSHHALFNLVLVSIQIVSGGFVAGLHAGLIYNNFPFMGNALIPDDLLHMAPWYMNFLDNPSAVQFFHRILGITIAISIFIYYFRLRNYISGKFINKLSLFLLGVVLCQVGLGIVTLLYNVPLVTALLHQLCAVIVFMATLLIYYVMGKGAHHAK